MIIVDVKNGKLDVRLAPVMPYKPPQPALQPAKCCQCGKAIEIDPAGHDAPQCRECSESMAWKVGKCSVAMVQKLVDGDPPFEVLTPQERKELLRPLPIACTLGVAPTSDERKEIEDHEEMIAREEAMASDADRFE